VKTIIWRKVSSIILFACVLLVPQVIHAGFTGPYYGFAVCEIAHPNNCTLIGLWRTPAACKDMLGSFLYEHPTSCRSGRNCAPIGPGIAYYIGYSAPLDCSTVGLKSAWYYYDNGVLSPPLSLKGCKAKSKACFGVGFPNYEQGFKVKK